MFVAYACARCILSPVAVVMLSRHDTHAIVPWTSTDTSETSMRMKVVLRKICSQLARMFSQPASRAPIGMDADGAGVGGPDFVHQIEVEAFQGEVELEVSLDNLFGIGHKE